MPNTIVTDLVTTIIPVYNRAKMVVEAVESVLDQTYRPIEIILVDDGSTDDSASVLDTLAHEHPNIIRVIHQQNQGAAMARETGRLAARGEFIQYLDSDDLLHKDKFTLQVNALRDHPDAGIAYGYAQCINVNTNEFMDRWPDQANYPLTLFPLILHDSWWQTAAPLYRRSVTDDNGPWFAIPTCEDWEYDARIGSRGVPLVRVDAFVCTQRIHEIDHLSQRWLGGHERIAFFRRLHRYALEAGVSSTSTDMARFRKNLRYYAREYWMRGDPASATELHDWAIELGDNSAAVRAFGGCAKRLGRPFVVACERLVRLLK